MRTRIAGPAFAQWLKTQLAITGISRRQLAQLSGVDHSTISRLTLGQRMPSLETATKLARVLPDLREHLTDVPTLQGLSTRTTNAPARLEYALRSDEALTHDDVRAVMEFYLALRARGMAAQPGGPAQRLRPGADPSVRRLHPVEPSARLDRPASRQADQVAGRLVHVVTRMRPTPPRVSTLSTAPRAAFGAK